jgi:hypothetical protein
MGLSADNRVIAARLAIMAVTRILTNSRITVMLEEENASEKRLNPETRDGVHAGVLSGAHPTTNYGVYRRLGASAEATAPYTAELEGVARRLVWFDEPAKAHADPVRLLSSSSSPEPTQSSG